MSLLEVRGVTKRFEGLLAVDSVDLDVDEGEIVGVIGPNRVPRPPMIGARVTSIDRPTAKADSGNRFL